MQKEMDIEPNSPSGRLSCLVSQFCNLRVMLREKVIAEQSTIIAMMLKLDTELSLWTLPLSKDWDYTIIETTDEIEGVYERSYHVYSDFSRAGLWNNYRSVHITLLEEFLHQLDKADASSPLASGQAMIQMYRQRSHELIRQLATDICASVPFHLTHPHPRIAPAGAIFFLLWPLFVAGAAEAVPHALHLWVLNRLDYIKDITGIGLARSLANFVRKEEMVPGINQPIIPISKGHEDAGKEIDLSKDGDEDLRKFFSS